MQTNDMTEFQTSNKKLFLEESEMEQQENNEPAESSTEDIITEESPSYQGEDSQDNHLEENDDQEDNTDNANEDLPWHKNPRFKQMMEDNKQLKELKSRLEMLEQSNKQTSNTAEEVPDEYKHVFGENVQAYKNWEELEQKSREKFRQEILAEEAQKAKEQEEQLKLVQTKIENIENQFGVSLPKNSKLRSEFLQFLVDHKIGGQQGQYDFESGWKLFDRISKAKKSSEIDKKRQVASKASSLKNNNVTNEDTVYTLDGSRLGRK
jgi:hypothetical protein